MAVVLTALAPQFGYSLCRDFNAEFLTAAQSWNAYYSLNGVIFASVTVALATKAPKIQDPISQSIAVGAWAAGILFIYSFLMHISRMKNGRHPFKLFL
jgi:OST3 / OST6 family, transporter family